MVVFIALSACFISPSKKTGGRETSKLKTGPEEKVATAVTAARADTKGRSTPDHHGEVLKSS